MSLRLVFVGAGICAASALAFAFVDLLLPRLLEALVPLLGRKGDGEAELALDDQGESPTPE